MSAFSCDFHKNKPYYLPLLLLISVISHFPFVLKGFGELDATRIGVSVIDIIKHGSGGAFVNFYFTDVIPLYVLYLKLFMKLLNNNFSYLPLVMNYTNAVFGTLSIIPAYVLINRLFNNPAVSFCSVLVFIFTPVFYQSTIMGFPHLMSFFFLLSSFCFYLVELDTNRDDIVASWSTLTFICLTAALLFKMDYVLGVGAYIGLLYVRRIKSRKKIISTLMIITAAGLLSLIIRYLIIGSTGGATSSDTGMSEWVHTFIGSSPASIDYLKRQVPPIFYAAGIMTFLLGIIAFAYHIVKKNLDVLVVNLSWAALPTITWIIIHGNNARHNMLSMLPFIVIIVMVFYEKAPKYTVILTILLILGNYFIAAPSSSILRPSGNLIKSHNLLENRMTDLHSKARQIAGMNEDKIAILGYFHNPYAIYEILSSVPSYEAEKIGRENYQIKTAEKIYMVFYVDISEPESSIESILSRFDLTNYVFVSVSHNLKWLKSRGFKIREIGSINIEL